MDRKLQQQDKDDFEITDVEDFREADVQFSHQVLVMSCLKKCMESGIVEMVEGKMETKKDKLGNTLTIYRADTRKKFIESVKTAKDFMICDFDDEAIENTNLLLMKIKKSKKYWINKEFEWWNSLDEDDKDLHVKNNTQVIKGIFNINNSFYNFFLDEEVEFYRRMLEQLNFLTKRLDFYKSEEIGG